VGTAIAGPAIFSTSRTLQLLHRDVADNRGARPMADQSSRLANGGSALSSLQLLELLRRRRSARTGFIEDKPVSDEQIGLLLEAARSAPSAGNGQPWEFVVIRDRATRHQIADLFRRQLQDKIELERAIRGHATVGGSVGFRLAPVLILVLGDPRTSASFPLRTQEEKAESHFYSSLASATLQMMLMAECLGLGCQYISDASSPYFALMLKHLLGIPADLKVYHLVPVGHLSVRPQPHGRRPLEAMVHYDRYDASKYRTAEDIARFIQDGSIQADDYKWGGSRGRTQDEPA
jgi:nitroreductase